jgi:hypothetical protein
VNPAGKHGIKVGRLSLQLHQQSTLLYSTPKMIFFFRSIVKEENNVLYRPHNIPTDVIHIDSDSDAAEDVAGMEFVRQQQPPQQPPPPPQQQPLSQPPPQPQPPRPLLPPQLSQPSQKTSGVQLQFTPYLQSSGSHTVNPAGKHGIKVRRLSLQLHQQSTLLYSTPKMIFFLPFHSERRE